jgi:hypothetical protein
MEVLDARRQQQQVAAVAVLVALMELAEQVLLIL